MEKSDAIKKAYEERKRQHDKKFEGEVEHLVFEIEDLSNRLRQAKKRLTELEYKEPEITADIEDLQ